MRERVRPAGPTEGEQRLLRAAFPYDNGERVVGVSVTELLDYSLQEGCGELVGSEYARDALKTRKLDITNLILNSRTGIRTIEPLASPQTLSEQIFSTATRIQEACAPEIRLLGERKAAQASIISLH